jgi:hypothetical protein
VIALCLAATYVVRKLTEGVRWRPISDTSPASYRDRHMIPYLADIFGKDARKPLENYEDFRAEQERPPETAQAGSSRVTE